MTAPHFPGDDDAWTGGPVLTGTGPETQPGGGATTNASEAGTGGLMESGRSGATTNSSDAVESGRPESTTNTSDAGTGGLMEPERSGATTNTSDAGSIGRMAAQRSGASALSLGWLIIIDTVFVQMTLSSYIFNCVSSETPALTTIIS